ncbi:rhomboid family intramembrane serine protease [Halobacillus salinarum]|uniref:Rhomboid family intramembrane serine protease n=1 Tax=Halobacillus salinarum TaxID=2932257 RepID=A0ABY4EDI7_9BACI|nr:rhomboid family intramembrane serine protease [Halobacillus salinarum]UOQ42519.1 rhomboid family intramembrane serine protease [Halobacillus salinarum]
MFLRQEYTFWKISSDLVISHGFEILHMSPNEDEIWLEKELNWKTHVVRLKLGQWNWKNQLKFDLNRTYQQVKQNRALFSGGKAVLHTLYISEYPPVDDWQDVTEELVMNKGSLNIHLYYLDDANKRSELKKLYQTFGHMPPGLIDETKAEEMESVIPYLRQQTLGSDQKRKKENLSVFDYGRPFMTYLLLVVNIAFFAFIEWKADSTSLPSLIEYGAKYNPAIISGEWWRIITSMFIHIGFLHLFMNMLALYYLGTAVERIYGTVRFTLIYFLAGIFGGVASFMMNPQIAAGASGAIFGLFGALLFFGVKHKRLFFRTMGTNVVFIIALNLVFGFVVPQVDNSAHVGGLIGGFLASALIQLPNKPSGRLRRVAFLIYSLAAVGMVWLGINQYDRPEHSVVDVQYSQELIKERQYTKVIQTTTDALDNPGEYQAELLFNRSYAYTQTNQLEKAKEDLEKTVDVKPDMAEAHFNLALIYLKEGKPSQAKEHARTAAELKPKKEEFQNLLKSLDQ